MSDIKPGYYFDLPEETHHSIQALSKSGVKKLIVDPLDYWESAPWNYDPAAEAESETNDRLIGSGRHKLLMEGEAAFDQAYRRRLTAEDHPGALVGMEDLKGWLRERGLKVGGSKQDLIERCVAADPEVLILDRLQALQGESLEPGQRILAPAIYEEINRVRPLADRVTGWMGKGRSEVTLVWEDEDWGCLCKARIDWIGNAPVKGKGKKGNGPARLVDLKDFTRKRGFRSERAIHDAVGYERYDIDGLFYLRAIEKTPRIANDQTRGAAAFFKGLDQLPEWLAHPEFVLLFFDKAGTFPRFWPKRITYRYATGGSRDLPINQTARASCDYAASLYNAFMESHGTEKPWCNGLMHKLSEIDFDLLPYSYSNGPDYEVA